MLDATSKMASDSSLVVTAVTEQMKARGQVEISSVGASMYPLIRHGDRCTFTPVEAERICRGDVVLYRSYGTLVGHRVHEILQSSTGLQYVCKGDANLAFDPPVHREQIVGKLVLVDKRWIQIRVNTWTWRAWGRCMIGVPSFAKVVHIYFQLRTKYRFERK